MDAQPKKVLVVDDDESVVAFVRTALEPDKFEVSGVNNGMAGLSQAREGTLDLIILDVYMPGQPGFFTLRDLKADPRTKGIPVIMLTSVGKRLGITYSTEDLYNVLGTEPDVYLEKPIDPLFLRQTAEKLVGIGSASAGTGKRNHGNGNS